MMYRIGFSHREDAIKAKKEIEQKFNECCYMVSAGSNEPRDIVVYLDVPEVSYEWLMTEFKPTHKK